MNPDPPIPQLKEKKMKLLLFTLGLTIKICRDFQKTPKDKKASLVIHGRVDKVT